MPTIPVGWDDVQDDTGCAYILGECDGRTCGAPLSFPVDISALNCPYCHTATSRA